MSKMLNSKKSMWYSRPIITNMIRTRTRRRRSRKCWRRNTLQPRIQWQILWWGRWLWRRWLKMQDIKFQLLGNHNSGTRGRLIPMVWTLWKSNNWHRTAISLRLRVPVSWIKNFPNLEISQEELSRSPWWWPSRKQLEIAWGHKFARVVPSAAKCNIGQAPSFSTSSFRIVRKNWRRH